MRTTVCYSVRVKTLRSISDKAVLIETFDGAKDVFPKSQIYGVDRESRKSDAYWISEWILRQKSIQWSEKKMRLVSKEDSGNLDLSPKFVGIAIMHTPEYIAPVKDNNIEALKR